MKSPSALCPEEAIDELLFRAETGRLRDGDLLTIIKACRLSAVEVDQLVEYLWTKGIDLPDINWSQFYNNIPKDSETNDWDLLFKYYCKKSIGWKD